MQEFAAFLTVRGHGSLQVRGPDGKLRSITNFDNLVVDAGKNRLTTLSADTANTPNKFQAIVIGTGSTAPAAGDTDLDGTISDVDTRQSATFAGPGALGVTGKFRLSTSHTNITATISEAGIFDRTDSSGQTMLARSTFSAVTLSDADTLNVLYSISFT